MVLVAETLAAVLETVQAGQLAAMALASKGVKSPRVVSAARTAAKLDPWLKAQAMSTFAPTAPTCAKIFSNKKHAACVDRVRSLDKVQRRAPSRNFWINMSLDKIWPSDHWPSRCTIITSASRKLTPRTPRLNWKRAT